MIDVESLNELDPDLAFSFVEENSRSFAFLCPIDLGDEDGIWAVSGDYSPLAANINNFASYADALDFIISCAPSKIHQRITA